MSNNQSQSFGYHMSYKVSSDPNAKNTDMRRTEIREIREIRPFSAKIRPFSGDNNEPFQVDMSYEANIEHEGHEKTEAETFLCKENTENRSIQNQKLSTIRTNEGKGQSFNPNMSYTVEGNVAGQSVKKPAMTCKFEGSVAGKSDKVEGNPENKLEHTEDLKHGLGPGISYKAKIKRSK